MARIICAIVFLLSLRIVTAQDQSIEDKVNALMEGMTVDEKIGQIFTIRAFSHDDQDQINAVKKQIKEYKVGGICFFQGSPVKQAELVNQYQKLSEIPLLMSIDGEWGLGMRFPRDAISFPKQLTLGAINDHQLIYLMGKEVGRQARLSGIQMNFAPVVDVNNNPNNPVINFRSFGEDRYNVASKAYAYMKGMKDMGVMACAKHFPGHGDTDVDSHHDLPVIPHGKRRLDSIELFPFKMMIHQGISALMVAHLHVPALDDRPNRPTTLSKKVIEGLIRKDLKFDGLVFTDGMEMKGVTKHFQPGEADVEAFLAGNDVILLPENIHEAIRRMKDAVKSGKITEERLDVSVRRILRAKFDLKLFETRGEATVKGLKEELNHPHAHVIKAKIYEKALTLVNNGQGALPIRELSGVNFASVSLGSDEISPFQKRMTSYADVGHFYVGKKADASRYQNVLKKVKDRDLVFVSLHGMSRQASRKFGLVDEQIQFVKDLSLQAKVILTVFGSPYALEYFDGVPSILVAYEDHELSQEAAAQALFGAIDITGKLPVTASERFPVGRGINVPSLNRIGYSMPEAVGLNSDTLDNIEIIVQEMIEEKAAPGCQVLIAKDNKIVYHKAFGHHTYDQKVPVNLEDIYDVASVTKIMASTLSIMHLQDQDKFNLNDPIAKYIPEEDTTNKASLIYEDVLSHVAGLAGWIPFYTSTLDTELKNVPSSKYYRNSSEPGFDIMVTPELFLRTDFRDTIWRKIFSSSLRPNNNYRYSDLAFYILNRTIKNITGLEVDGYAETNLYRPLGLRRTLFNPFRHFDRAYIPPSEFDQYWRNEVVQGTVHDMGAAMLGGVSGHAGLFSNSLELSVLMQMLLNGGYYGGKRFLNPKTIDYYTKRHWRSSRRGIGFDMKELDKNKNLNMSEKASKETFGHLGFTGTAAFADPDNDIIYVFLSNRTYPTMNNNKLGKGDYRPRIQSVIYDALMTE